LAQVEGALTASSDNEDLIKLKADLEQLISLTQGLVFLNEGAHDQSEYFLLYVIRNANESVKSVHLFA
jgi:hypothetical protein